MNKRRAADAKERGAGARDWLAAQRGLREHLVEMLSGGSAHLTFADALKGLAPKLRGARVGHSSHTPWRLVEHMRIAQWDILQFSTNERHESPTWPEGYWPAGDEPPSAADWRRTVQAFERDLAEMIELVNDKKVDLLEPIPWGDGKSIARQAMLLADHNAYHLGQLVELRRALGAWKD
jgi:hypothetical protein